MPGWSSFCAGAIAIALAACASSRMGGVDPDAGDPGGDGGAGDPDAADGAAVMPGNVLYVSVDGHDSADGREPSRALRHLGVAIDRAVACDPGPCRLVVAEGDYQEVVTLAGGVDVEGGWSPGFTVRDVLVHAVVITSADPVTVYADALAAPVTLDGLTIRGADLGARDDGVASIALRVRDAGDTLRLRSVRLEAGRGARGTPGADGTLATCVARGGEGGVAYDCGGNDGRRGDASGDAISSGAGGTPGSSNCPNACPLVGSDGVSGGAAGGNGANGGDGPAGTPASDDDGGFDADTWTGAAGAGGQRGGHGTGGSGGGSGGSKRFRVCFGCGTLLGGRGGDGAAGGCGGGGAAAGGPGGASFAAVLIRSSVGFEGVRVFGGSGGAGGAGGDGHPGGPGGTNGAIGLQGAPSQQCGAITYRAGAGAAGGIGGHGGHGGGGAGGVGGPAIGVALIGGAIVPAGEPGANTYGAGTGGAGGAGGTGAITAPSGVVGRVADVATF